MAKEYDLTTEEMETHISMDATDRSKWLVYSSDPVLIKRISKITEPYKTDDWGAWFMLNKNQVSFRQGKQISDEERQKRSDRMKALRTKQLQAATH